MASKPPGNRRSAPVVLEIGDTRTRTLYVLLSGDHSSRDWKSRQVMATCITRLGRRDARAGVERQNKARRRSILDGNYL